MSTRFHRARRRAAIIAVVIAAGLAALFLLRGREEPGPAPRAAAPPTRPSAPLRVPAAAPEEPLTARPDARPLALVAARSVEDPAASSGSIEGRVVSDATGAGVAGAELVLLLAGGATTTLTTDAGGGFRYRSERAETVTIASVTADGHLPFAPEWGHSPIQLVVRPGFRVTDVVLYLAPATEWLGVVLAPDGSPVAGAEVRIIDTPAAEQELVAIDDRFTTDRRGELRFRAPEGALLEARAEGYGPARATLDEGARSARKLVLRLGAGGPGNLGSARITGVVLRGANEPAAGVLVSARPEQQGTELVASGQALTGEDGRFAIDGLDPRAYVVETRMERHGQARAEVVLGPGEAADVRLEVGGGVVLGGLVSDSAGDPVPAFTVVVSEAGALGTARPTVTRTFVNPGGGFAISGLERGEYIVQASAHGHAPSRPVEVEVDPPFGLPAVVHVTLPAGGTLIGVVREAGGGSIYTAPVTTETFGRRSVGYQSLEMRIRLQPSG